MALVGNRSVLLKSPGRNLGGTVACVDRSNYSKPGALRNAAFSPFAGLPYGHLAGSSWLLPQKAGAMSSRNAATASFSAAGQAVGGVTADAAASFAFTVDDAAGQLISSGAGAASFAIAPNAPLLTASIGATGSASFSVQCDPALLGALAGAEGAAGFSFSGSLVPYAIGSMSGSTVDSTVLTSDAIATAVWQAVASANNTDGSMGAKLNSAASGGVDYASMADAVRTELQAELLRIVELAQLHGLVVGTDLVVTPTARSAGSVVQTVAESGGTVTVSRAP